MREQPFLIDGAELLADAIQRFAGAVVQGDFEEAERFAVLAFYLFERRRAG